MTLERALAEIAGFWPKDAKPFWAGGGFAAVERLERAFGQKLPKELAEYVRDVAPKSNFWFAAPGNGICLYGLRGLRTRQDGYNYNPLTKEVIEGWTANWFLIGDEGGDPCMVDLASSSPTVLIAMHGAGTWRFQSFTDSIASFLVCAAAVHHAVTHWDRLEASKETDVYHEDASAWLKPVLKRWASDDYHRWYDF